MHDTFARETAIENLPAEYIDTLKLKYELGVELDQRELYALFYMMKIRELREIQKVINEQVALTSAKGLCQEEEQRPQHPLKVGGKE